MATSFDGLGMGQLGTERSRFKGPNEPSLGKALLGIGLQKAGVIKDLDELSNPQSTLRKKIIDVFSSQPRATPAPVEDRSFSAAPPPGMGANENAAILSAPPPVAPQPVAPVMQQDVPVTAPVAPQSDIQPIDNDQLVDEVFPRRSISSFVAPNTLAQRNPSEDIGMLQLASIPATPPPSMNLPQYGQNQGGNTLATLAKLLFD